MNPYFEYWLCAGVLMLSMLGMGATLSAHEFVRLVKAPRRMLLVLVAQIGLAPLLALAVAKIFFLSPGLSMGLVIVSSLPGGAFSNLVTHLGRGNVALSISCTTLATVLSVVTTAAVLRLYGGRQMPDEFTLPIGRIVVEVALFLLTPLLVGLVARRFHPRWSLRMSRRAIQGSVVLLAVFVATAMLSGQVTLWGYGLRAPLALILFFIGSLWLGYGFALWCNDSRGDGFAMGIEVAVRNTGLGLLIKASLFPAGSVGTTEVLGEAVLYVLLVYGGLSLGMAMLEVYFRLNHIGILNRLPE